MSKTVLISLCLCNLYESTLIIVKIFFQLEKSFGDTKHIRRVFQRAIERVKDFPETICEAW